jgi:predicted nicotinamide N-methyase
MNFEVQELKIQIRNKEFRILEVTNFDELYDELIKKEGSGKLLEDYIPYWTELWPSAIALSEYLLDHPELIKDKKVIELGCGLALPSLVAASIEPYEVIATDIISDALTFAAKNALTNQNETIQFKILDWTKNLFALVENSCIILASDIIYERRFCDQFVEILSLLAKKTFPITIILSEPNRNVTKNFVGAVSKLSQTKHRLSTKEITNRGTNFKINIHLFEINP